ncbi:MAG TPA: glycosyltransferase family 39 protein, partial [Polyangiaceae bacterium]
MKREVRREVTALGVVLAVALALRVAYILSRQGDLLFDHPVVDEERYVVMGRALAAGQVPDPRPWFHPPGLTYALGLVFKVAGSGLMAPRLVQALVGTASIALAYVVAKRLLGPRVALATAAVCAVHGVLVFECYELLPPVWMLAADLLALWALLRAGDKQRWGDALGAGAALGVASIFGPTVLPFAALGAWWLRRPPLVGAFVVGVVLAIAPVTARNWQSGHELVLISTNGGINFYLGNNEHYDETLAIRPGVHWDELKDRPHHSGVESEGGASAWYYQQGLAFWREHPAQAASLYARKLYLYFDGPEIPRDTDVQTLRSGPLSVLVSGRSPYVPDGILVPLALVGMALCWRERRRLWLLHGFVAEQALVVAAFFVSSRYRVPAVPVLAMFACEGVRRVNEAWREPGSLVRRVVPSVA